MSLINQRIQNLRQAMHRLGANAFYCTLSDAHLSEYIQEADKFLTFLSGFTGSNAQLIVTDNQALLWTDSRYWEQAALELNDSGIVLMREGKEDVLSPHKWLTSQSDHTPVTLAVALETVSSVTFKKLKESVSAVVDFQPSEIDHLWTDRPHRTIKGLYIHHASSVSAHDKLKRLQSYLQSQNGFADSDSLLLTRLDDIAWLTNLRGSDIEFNPIFLSWALVSKREACLFVHTQALTEEITLHLQRAGWRVLPYETFEDELSKMNASIWAREEDLNAKVFTLIHDRFKPCKHPVALWKSVKTPEEIAGLKEVMKADGQALEDFIEEIKDRLARGERLTENDAVDILHQKRSAIPGFIGESFGTIAAVNANAALPHYEPISGRGAPIEPPCLLLVDSGAHYDKGTTDTTRVWFLGDSQDYPSEDLQALKRDYTAVYKAMKALSEATFKPGTTGFELDKIARAPIHAIGADFGHGTGHGIGLTLNVHETPPSISPREREGTMTPFEPGMIVSDEPGIYRPGQWGIRIENMLVCVQKAENLLGFETLTQCKIDTTLLLQ